MKIIIHVNQHIIRKNTKEGTDLPCLSVRSYKDLYRCHEVVVSGECRTVYKPHAPLSCGARVWIETHSRVECYAHGEIIRVFNP